MLRFGREKEVLFVSFDPSLFDPVNNFLVMSGQAFLGRTSTMQRIKYLAQGHNTVTPSAVRLKLATPRPPVHRSTN